MCRRMVDIQSATAEIRRGKTKERRKKQDKDTIMSASATQGGHNEVAVAANWRLSTRSVVRLARSRVYDTKRLAARSP